MSNDNVDVISEVCSAISRNQLFQAEDILARRYPFIPREANPRQSSERQKLATYIRDGFIDRYSGKRLVWTPVLRLISMRLPQSFPYQRNWKMDACHYAFWEITPTIDHIMPIAKGGSDDPSNWVTTSMVLNSAKANFTLEELGWTLRPPGNSNEWDGLLGWFTAQAKSDPSILEDKKLKEWFKDAIKLTEASS